MTLIARIEDELKAARLARDEDRRDALSFVLSSLQSAQKELQRPLSDDEELQVLQRERKRRVEAAEAFRAGGREEQAEDEEYELEILEEFMPEPLSEDELEEIIDDVISEVGATSIRDLGRVMAGVMHQVSGRADGSTVSPARQGKARLTWARPNPVARRFRRAEKPEGVRCAAACRVTEPESARTESRSRNRCRPPCPPCLAVDRR